MTMYYDLIASLPHLPHFERADRSPITRLRLQQRLRSLRPEHADQLAKVRAVVSWHPQNLFGGSDKEWIAACTALMDSQMEQSLREFVALRAEQQTLLAALRRKQYGLSLPEGPVSWGLGPRVHMIRRRWETLDFGLTYVVPWLPEARALLEAGNASGLERLLMDHAWGWLSRCSERSMFSVDAVFSYVLRWDILQAWLANNADLARTRFSELVDKVTHVEHN